MDVLSKIKEIVANQMGVKEEELTPETTFQSLEADSLDVVEIIMALEEEFNLEIADEEAENLKNLDDLVAYISNNQA